jgi:hyperosmotically inducible protein
MKKSGIFSICMLCFSLTGTAIAAQSAEHLASLVHDKQAAAKETKLTDNQLADNVRSAFEKEKLFGKDKFADMGIHVTAKNGVVTLSGKVANKSDIDKAIKIARGVDQVKNVKSNIDVKKSK